MNVIDQEDKPFEELAKGSGLPRTTDRVHLTDIIKYIGHTCGFDANQASFKDLQAAGEIGFMWEDLLSSVFKDRMGVRPAEMEQDGVLYSPDGIGVLGEPFNTPALEEYKATWHSSRKKPTDVWRWMTQCKAYCYAIGVNIVVMHILYVVGDYYGSGPTYRRCVIEYTGEELLGNWNMILQNKEEAWKWVQSQAE
jgi:hypothetical protein